MAFVSSLKNILFGTKPPAQSIESIQPRGLRSSAPPSTLHPAIIEELNRLALFDPAAVPRAIRYIEMGNEVDFLDKLSKVTKSVNAYQFPYYSDSIAWNATRALPNIALARGEIAAGPQLARFINLRLAIDRSHHYSYGAPKTSEQIMAAEIFNAVSNGLSKISSEHKERVPWSDVITLPQILAMFKCCGCELADALEVLWITREADFLHDGHWLSGSDFGLLLRDYPAIIAQSFDRARANSQMTILRVIAHHKVLMAPELIAIPLKMAGKGFSKPAQEFATSTMAKLDVNALTTLLVDRLDQSDADGRHILVQIVGRNGAPELLAILLERAKVEKSGKVKSAIAALLETNSPANDDPAVTAGTPTSYVSISGAKIDIPSLETDVLELSDTTCRVLTDRLLDLIDADRTLRRAQSKSIVQSDIDRLAPISDHVRDQVCKMMTGEALANDELKFAFTTDLARPIDTPKLLEFLTQAPLAFSLRVLTWMARKHALSAMCDDYTAKSDAASLILRTLVQNGCDMRIVATYASRLAPSEAFNPAHLASDVENLRGIFYLADYRASYHYWRNPLEPLPREAAWPWLLANGAIFDETFGLAPSVRPLCITKAISMLTILPAPPQRYYA